MKKIDYNNKTYVFFTNEKKKRIHIIIAIYKKLNIDAIFLDTATDIAGNPLPDNYEVFIEENDYNSNKLDKAVNMLAKDKIWELYTKGEKTISGLLGKERNDMS